MPEWFVGWFSPREPRQALPGSPRLLASGGGLAPCWACLRSKGGPSLADILLLWLDIGLFELHVGSSSLLALSTS